jgi:hypothetical protein
MDKHRLHSLNEDFLKERITLEQREHLEAIKRMRFQFTNTSYIDEAAIEQIITGGKKLNIRALALVLRHQMKLLEDAQFQAISMCQRNCQLTDEGLCKL